MDKKIILDQPEIEKAQVLARVFQKADRTISGAEVKCQVRVPDYSKGESHAPASNNGEVILFNANYLGDLNDLKELVALNGLNYHELSHVLYTPRARTLPVTIKGNPSMFRIFNMLEDQRIESLFTGMFPATKAYFTMVVMKHILSNPNTHDRTFPLLWGRQYLGLELRERLARLYMEQGDVAAIKKIVDEYRTLAYPRDIARGAQLTEDLHALLDSSGLTSDHQMRQVDPFGHNRQDKPLREGTSENTREQKAAHEFREQSDEEQAEKDADVKDRLDKEDQERQSKGTQTKDQPKSDPEKKDEDTDSPKGDKDDSEDDKSDEEVDGGSDKDDSEDDKSDEDSEDGSGEGDKDDEDQEDSEDDSEGEAGSGAGEDSDEDTDGSGEDDANGEGSAEKDGEDSDEDGFAESAGLGEGSRELTREETEAERDALEALARDAMNGVMENSDVKQDAEDKRKLVLDGDGDIGVDQCPTVKYTKSTPTGIERNISKKVGMQFERIARDLDPGFQTHKDSGRINVSRAMRGEALDTVFDQWNQGKFDAAEMEIVIGVDISGSIGNNDVVLSHAVWTVMNALRPLGSGVSATAFTFNGGVQLLYSAEQPVRGDTIRMVANDGGTDPQDFLRYAKRIFKNTQKKKRILIMMTDGSWSNSDVNDRMIDELNSAGVTTGMMYFRQTPYWMTVEGGGTGADIPELRRQHGHGMQLFHKAESLSDLIPFVTNIVKKTMKG